ncbi:iron transporter [Niastella koreensis]|uniref:Natural resistance-associated macrophage protein n=2 Tax=Niastella koreensis TaxID=354356 RepID=G8TBS6_NIAKG|nr:Nramp family divalent metal transporter [Niastella koreensis]AEV98208.1 natural resistance-associated macrophage protein [Niastella koreensis GR20-10]OQP44333.1 iron transporter [Niastella koreensis]
MGSTTGLLARTKKILKVLGPGLITGASDDDPSGIATYSQAGAQFGFQTLWTALITLPLMTGIQEMCARIGLVTTVGLTTTLKRHYPKWILYLMMVFSIPAIILNIGADIAGMGAVANLLFPSIKPIVFSFVFTVVLFVLIVFLPYEKIVAVLKYLCLSMFLYIAVPFFTHPNWTQVLRNTVVPSIQFNKDFIEILVAILGTTISPYLFFWQVTMEAEGVKSAKQLVLARRKLNRTDKENPDAREQGFVMRMIKKMQLDVNFGMFLSTLVMFFIILATGSALNLHGIKQIDTVEQAAKALEPVAGKASYLMFALGVMGTGLLAIPVLAGSLSYVVAETFGWRASLDHKYWQAKEFYLVILVSLAVGLLINYIGLSPIKALFYTAILYGLTCPIIIAIVLHIGNNKNIMKQYTNSRLSNTLGILTLIIMTAAAASLIYFQFV